MLHRKALVKTKAPLGGEKNTKQRNKQTKKKQNTIMARLDRKTKIRAVTLFAMFIYMVVLIIVIAGTILLALQNAIGAIITFTSLGLLSFGLVAALQWFLSSLESSARDPPPPYRASWWFHYWRRSASNARIQTSALHERSALDPATPSNVSLSSVGVGVREEESDGGTRTADGRVFISLPKMDDEDPPSYEEAMRACAAANL
ncbi:uncharacterized protein LOC125038128 [Penaeus chinensis]|uniref:uncharacterized protein LOC125038128 n=1 Tax=Penaeus chinensis TaxID=139456 RepID=UPI001FB82BBF|nr:uncharacterized protein LOC125038128 [Penaeus chinensis]